MTSEFENSFEFKDEFHSSNLFPISLYEENLFDYYFQDKQLDPLKPLNSEEEENEFFKNIIFRSKGKESTSDSQHVIDKDIFKIEKLLGNKKNRDKKPIFKKVGNRNHDKYDIDNILTVIQTHFINFIVNFINYILEEKGIKEKFIKISYEEKRKVNRENFENLKLLM